MFSIGARRLKEHYTFRKSVPSYRKLTSESSSLCRIGLISLTFADWGFSIQQVYALITEEATISAMASA